MATRPPGLEDESKRVLSNRIFPDMEFLKYSAETGGAYTHVRQRVPAGERVPAHYHRLYQETFTSLSGVLTLTLDGTDLTLQPGESGVVPIGHVHCFQNRQSPSDEKNGEVEFECRLEPGHEGFEKSWYIFYGLGREGKLGKDGVPKGLIDTCIVSALGDIQLAGWGWTIGMPVIRYIARFAQAMGWEEQLVRKYWC